jgi:signal transduction histidine kinase
MDSVKLARLALALAALAAGALTATLTLTGGVSDSPTLDATFGLLIGLAWCSTGFQEWRRRPANLIGPLMICVGFAWFGSRLAFSEYPALFTIGHALAALHIAFFAHVLLAFPSGRLESGLARAIVIASYVDTTVVVWASVIFDNTGHPENLALVDARNDLSERLGNLASGIGVVLSAAALCLLAVRWHRATPPWRRAVAPVLFSGWAAVAVGGIALLAETVGEVPEPIDLAYLVTYAIVPFAFKLGLLRSRLARGAVADLVVELGENPAPGKLRDALARALHDPSLSVAYWLPDRERFVDLDGQAFDLPTDRSRVATIVEREGRRVAAIIHDSSLCEDRELVDAVCAAAGLALENERLQAELRSRLDELRASRARIVEATDAERKRIERNLHDATQQRLVSISMALGLADSRLDSDPEASRRILAEARQGLSIALRELRDLSQGIHPALLTERGLEPALTELAYRAPMPVDISLSLDDRLPERVEAAAYYVVAEGLTNVVKYASATGVSVRVGRTNGRAVVEVADDGVGGADPVMGTGLRGLSDRVEALGGAFAVESPEGVGTILRADIPCAS